MEKFFNSNNTFTIIAKRHAHEIMIVKNLVYRIQHKIYSDEDYLFDEYMTKQDLKYLGLMLRKHLRNWWD